MFLYDDTIHVPLLLKLPAEPLGGKRVEERVALAEVAPTLLEAAGVSAPGTMQAHSLFPLIDAAKIDVAKSAIGSKGKAPERIVADTLESELADFQQKTSSVRSEQTKLDPTQAEKLGALGYLTSDSAGANTSEKGAIDPKRED